MTSRTRIITWSTIAAIISIAGIGISYFLLNNYASTPSPHGNPIATSSPPSIQHAPEITLQTYRTETKNIFIITWKYLPDGTTRLDIYRAKSGTQDWSLWKSVFVPTGEEQSGIAEIVLSLKENTNGYLYYVEAVRGTGGGTTGGEVVWTSPQNLPVTPTNTLPPLPPPPPPSTPSGSTPPPTPTTPGPAPALAPAPAPSPSPSSPSPSPRGSPSPSPSYPPGTIIYYKPESGVSGTSQPQTAHFWASIINNAIEIGWQNLPEGSDHLIVSRSKDTNQPWNQVLTQKNPVYNGPYTIRVSDQTIYESYYSKMDVFSSSSVVLASYGPILVRPQ